MGRSVCSRVHRSQQGLAGLVLQGHREYAGERPGIHQEPIAAGCTVRFQERTQYVKGITVLVNYVGRAGI